jgi:hypothetical protein
MTMDRPGQSSSSCGRTECAQLTPKLSSRVTGFASSLKDHGAPRVDYSEERTIRLRLTGLLEQVCIDFHRDLADRIP